MYKVLKDDSFTQAPEGTFAQLTELTLCWIFLRYRAAKSMEKDRCAPLATGPDPSIQAFV
jgi:hypothetical protein